MNDALEIFPWNDNFSIGIPEIDAQHKKLVQMLNRLGSDLVFNSDHIDLSKLFNELAEYAVYHFQTEENVWHQFLAGDRWETAHKGSHESFVADLTKLRSEEGIKPLHEVMEDILIFLTHWLAYHILENDKRTAMIVLAVQSGMSIEQAKQKTHQEMTGATGVLIDTVSSSTTIKRLPRTKILLVSSRPMVFCDNPIDVLSMGKLNPKTVPRPTRE